MPGISDSDRAVAFRNISLLYQGKSIDSAVKYGQRSIDLAVQTNNNNLLTPALIQQASNFIWAADFDKAYDLLTQCIAIAEEDKRYHDLQDAYDLMSYIYQLTGVWDNAWKYALRSIEVKEQHPDAVPNSAASAHNSLANIYAALNDFDNAETYFNKAKLGYKKDNNFDNLANCYLDMAKMYIPQKKYLRAKNQLDTAFAMFVEEDEEIQIADAYETYGLFFLDLDQFDSSLSYYLKALEIYNAENLSVDIQRVNIGLGKIAYFRGNLTKAKELLTNAYIFFKPRKESALRLSTLLWLHKTDQAAGNTANAAQYFNEYLNLTDSVTTLNSELRARELTAQYDLETKKKENEELKTKNDLQQQWFVILIVSAIVVFFVCLLLYLSYRQKNNALREVKRMQEQTETNNKELEKLNNVKDKLISMIAHDIRSPLASLQNTLSLTIDNTLNKEEFFRLGRILEGEMFNLRGMLDNMLLWARQHMMDIKVNKTKFNICSSVSEILALYKNNITHKQLKVHNRLPDECEVWSDKDIITTVIRNILSNAIKFTEPGKNINISQQFAGNRFLLTISDEGTGIANDVMNKINNQEFVSNRGTSNEKGTGLGILFSRELLHKLGENLVIQSEPGKGTQVTISITQENMKLLS